MLLKTFKYWNIFVSHVQWINFVEKFPGNYCQFAPYILKSHMDHCPSSSCPHHPNLFRLNHLPPPP